MMQKINKMIYIEKWKKTDKNYKYVRKSPRGRGF